jgi:hypothetical protein
MSRLAKSEPGRDDWQRDLGVTYSAVGDVLKTQSKMCDALKSYQESVTILERLAKANSEWQRDLSVTYVRLADFYQASGQSAKARKAFAAGRAIMARLVALFPQQARLKQDYAWFDAQKSAQLK